MPTEAPNEYAGLRTSQERHWLLTDGVILAGCTGFSYLVAYLHELAYGFIFGIDPQLIDLKWSSILVGAVSSLALGMLTYLSLTATRPKRTPGRSVLRKSVSRVLRLTGVTLLVAFAVCGPERWRLALGAAAFAFVEYTIVEVSARFASSKSVDEKPDLSTQLWAALRKSHLLRFGFFVASLTLPLALLSGAMKAMNKQDFLVTTGMPAQVVLRIYGERIVTAELDRESGAILPIYQVLPISESSRVFREEHLGQVAPVCPHGNWEANTLTQASPSRYADFLNVIGLYSLTDQKRCARYKALMKAQSKP